jgi:hypothetical protein
VVQSGDDAVQGLHDLTSAAILYLCR